MPQSWIHRENWEFETHRGERSALASQIEDLRLAEFARRLIYFERPETLSDAQSAELSAWMANRVLTEDESVPWMTIKKALRETDVLLRNARDEKAGLLRDVREFLYSRAEDISAGG